MTVITQKIVVRYPLMEDQDVIDPLKLTSKDNTIRNIQDAKVAIELRCRSGNIYERSRFEIILIETKETKLG